MSHSLSKVWSRSKLLLIFAKEFRTFMKIYQPFKVNWTCLKGKKIVSKCLKSYSKYKKNSIISRSYTRNIESCRIPENALTEDSSQFLEVINHKGLKDDFKRPAPFSFKIVNIIVAWEKMVEKNNEVRWLF